MKPETRKQVAPPPWLVLEEQLQQTIEAIGRLAKIDPAHHPTASEKQLVQYLAEKLDAAKQHEYEAALRHAKGEK